MSDNLYILPPDKLNFIIYGFGGVGALIALIFIVLTCVQVHSSVCRSPEKEDLEKLNAVEQLLSLKEEADETTGDRKTKSSSTKKKDV